MIDKKISIIMPVYNAGKYLDDSIKSVLEQSYANFELIIIDDGSVDNSIQIIKKYMSDKRIKLITQQNKGPSSARNVGINSISGDFLMFLDADDYLDKTALKMLLDTIIRYNADMCIYAWKEFKEKSRNHYFSKNEISKNYEGIYADIIYSPVLCGGGYPWNKCWRVEAIRRQNSIIMFDEKLYLYEDKLWTIQNLDRIEKIVFLNECIYNYRIQNSSLSHADKNQLGKLYHSYEASVKIQKYVSENHINLCRYSDDLEWLFKLNYIFGVKIQKKTGKVSDDFDKLYKAFREEKYRKLGVKSTIKYFILKIVQKFDNWR